MPLFTAQVMFTVPARRLQHAEGVIRTTPGHIEGGRAVDQQVTAVHTRDRFIKRDADLRQIRHSRTSRWSADSDEGWRPVDQFILPLRVRIQFVEWQHCWPAVICDAVPVGPGDLHFTIGGLRKVKT